MLKEVTLKQAEIDVGEFKFTITQIPTATSESWYTIHDTFEIWAAVCIDLKGKVIYWRNPPAKPYVALMVTAIKKEFSIP